jgi:hypothetical protein
VEVEVRPEPPQDERDALLAALSGGTDEPPAYASPWRLAALQEAAEDAEP